MEPGLVRRETMTRRAFVAGFAVLAAAAAQEPTFRVNVKLVRILATVKNSGGQLVGSLGKSDFEIYDNSVKQEIALFEHHTEQPLSISLLMDTSASVGIDLKYELQSISRFFRAVFREGNAGDAIKLYTFSWETVERTSFTRRAEILERALRGVRSEGGTSLYDAMYFAAGSLEDRDGRHVMVIVTDGGDTTSSKNFDQALQAAQMADAVIYPILVVPIANEAGRNTGGENALTTLAERTGGRVFAPTLGEQLDAAFDEILRELRTQYLLGFYPRNVPLSKDSFHRLEVKAKKPDLRVLARSGYYGEAEEARGWTPVRQ